MAVLVERVVGLEVYITQCIQMLKEEEGTWPCGLTHGFSTTQRAGGLIPGSFSLHVKISLCKILKMCV